MALSVKVGSITARTTTGSQATTGVGFQPKALILYATFLTADGGAAAANVGFGFGTSSSSRAAIGWGGGDNTTTVNTYDYCHSNAHIIYVSSGTGGLSLAADLTSLDADGFTLNYTTVQASAYVINYIALGGSDLTNATIKQLQAPAATGSQSYTGVGFKPDAIIAITNASTATPPTNGGQGNDPFYSIGYGTSANAEATGGDLNDTGTVSKNGSVQTSHIIYGTHGTTITEDATLTSLDADGFTWNWLTTVSNAYTWVLCLKGGQYKVGTISQKTSTGSQATTGVGFQTTGLILQSWNFTSSASANTTAARLSIGAGSGSTSRGCIWWGALNNVSTLNVSQSLDRANIIKLMTESHASPTTQAAADLTSLDADGFTLNWGTADATAREIIYLAFGSNVSAPHRISTLTLLGIG